MDRLDAELERLILPLDLEGERLPLLLGQQGLDALNGVDLLAVDVGDYIACPQTAGPSGGHSTAGGLHIGQAGNHHTVRKELNTHRPAQGNDRVADLHRAGAGGGVPGRGGQSPVPRQGQYQQQTDCRRPHTAAQTPVSGRLF